ncbi:MAG: hypothetical protein MJA27_14885, partial [Pseudanabaenales cyanobacterium]|nr:hypothetical protein [Pseudanabaenales cyanobacterium]
MLLIISQKYKRLIPWMLVISGTLLLGSFLFAGRNKPSSEECSRVPAKCHVDSSYPGSLALPFGGILLGSGMICLALNHRMLFMPRLGQRQNPGNHQTLFWNPRALQPGDERTLFRGPHAPDPGQKPSQNRLFSDRERSGGQRLLNSAQAAQSTDPQVPIYSQEPLRMDSGSVKFPEDSDSSDSTNEHSQGGYFLLSDLEKARSQLRNSTQGNSNSSDAQTQVWSSPGNNSPQRRLPADNPRGGSSPDDRTQVWSSPGNNSPQQRLPADNPRGGSSPDDRTQVWSSQKNHSSQGRAQSGQLPGKSSSNDRTQMWSSQELDANQGRSPVEKSPKSNLTSGPSPPVNPSRGDVPEETFVMKSLWDDDPPPKPAKPAATGSAAKENLTPEPKPSMFSPRKDLSEAALEMESLWDDPPPKPAKPAATGSAAKVNLT